MATRQATSIGGHIKTMVGLVDTEVQLLATDEITNAEDLTYVQFEDLNVGINVLKRRKLDLVREYLILDPANKVTAITTIEDLRKAVDDAKSAPQYYREEVAPMLIKVHPKSILIISKSSLVTQ